MLRLPDPKLNPLLACGIRADTRDRKNAASIGDRLIAMQNREARRANLYAQIEKGTALPVRWMRPEPRPSAQYAGHMATTAQRDRRLTPQAKALLVVLRARCGNGMRTETCKTTLAHIMGVATRSIGRYIADLVRFGYLEARPRTGSGGLYVGLVLTITDKVLACFRKTTWLSGWLAQNLGGNGANPDRTELSPTNHSLKESSFDSADRPSG